MSAETTRLLLIQDNPEYVEFLEKRLDGLFEIASVSRLKEALEAVGRESFDLILLELSLPDSNGLETFEAVQAAASSTPIVVLTSLDDEIVALRAVQKGAQDYLLKGEVEGKILPRVIRYAIERHRMKTELVSLTFADDLTGLHNRRGFFVLAHQQMKMAERSRKGFLLILADVDGLKQINDIYGHQAGDAALRGAADVLRKTFRRSDILARIGGDEFAALAIEAESHSYEIILERLRICFEEYHESHKSEYSLSLSTGASFYHPGNPETIENLMAAADERLYRDKRGHARVSRRRRQSS